MSECEWCGSPDLRLFDADKPLLCKDCKAKYESGIRKCPKCGRQMQPVYTAFESSPDCYECLKCAHEEKEVRE